MRPERSCIVSIHDVCPPKLEQTSFILEALAEQGIDKTSLLVVPNYHHEYPIADDRGFLTNMRELQEMGHEIVLHGYYHLRQKPRRDTVARKLVTEFYTAGEGEFYDLPYDDAGKLLAAGSQTLQQSGLNTDGFIAPAWLLGKEAERAVKDAGFAYTTRLPNIKDLRSGQEHPSQSLVYSVRSGWRIKTSLLWNRWLLGRLEKKPVVRLGIHPPDFDHPEVKKQILEIASRLAATRTVTTYRDWITGLVTDMP